MNTNKIEIIGRYIPQGSTFEVVRKKEHTPIAHVLMYDRHGNNTASFQEANQWTDKFAACNDMLNALEEIISHTGIMHVNASEEWKEEKYPWLKQAKAAIKRAKGK